MDWRSSPPYRSDHMNTEQDNIVRVASGSLIQIEFWQHALTEAGIESKVVGEDLTSSFGTALDGSVELWVHSNDVDKAQATIQFAEDQKGKSSTTQLEHEHPESRLPSTTQQSSPEQNPE